MVMNRLVPKPQRARLQNKTITENGTYYADDGFDGFNQIKVDCPGDIPAVINELNVTPTTSTQTITPESGVDGFAPVNVAAVDSSIDENIVAGNIKSGVTILGVVGDYSGGSDPVINELNVTPTTSAQTITPESGVDGFAPVNVAAVTASIDSNIAAGNIKSGVTILGVSGSVVELVGETASVTPTTSAQTITPSAQHNGITEVSVAAVTASIDSNIAAGNIKSGVTILGVLGTYQGSGGTDEYSNVIDIENIMKGTSFVEEDEIDEACENISIFLYGTANA